MQKRNRGAAGQQYAIIVGLIAVVAIAAIASVGTNIRSLFTTTSNRLQAVGNTSTTSSGDSSGGGGGIYASCQAAKAAGQNTSGTFSIDPDGAGPLAQFSAYCDMTADGGGWTLVGYNDAPITFTNFNRTWAQYKAGFGGPSTGSRALGWVGNDRLNALTSGGKELRVLNLDSGSVLRPHFYSGFTVENEANYYRMTVTYNPATSNDGNFFTYHSGMYFTTQDSDHDNSPGSNCASVYSSGWWYNLCYNMTIAGSNTGQVYWRDGNGNLEYTNTISMWVR